MECFFDDYPRFYATSKTGPTRHRLGARHRAIIEGNERLLAGRRVLDIASHDGRWSFAALKAGAAHVTGIEARPHLVDNAIANLRHYGASDERFSFILGDAFEVLRSKQPVADTVLLLGFFYHVGAHLDLAKLISDTGASTIILDTCLLPPRHIEDDEFALIGFITEPTEGESNAVGPDARAIVGYPSRRAIELIFGHFGYAMREVNWAPLLVGDVSAVQEYADGRRSTFVLQR